MATIPLLQRGGVPVLDLPGLRSLGNVGESFNRSRDSRNRNELTAERLQDIAEQRGEREAQRGRDAQFSQMLSSGEFDINTPGGIRAIAGSGNFGPERTLSLLDRAQGLELSQAQLGEIGAGRRERAGAREGAATQAANARKASIQWAVENKVAPDIETASRMSDAGFLDDAAKVFFEGQKATQKRKGKPLTDAQAKAKGFADRMLEAEDIISEPDVTAAMMDTGAVVLNELGESLPFGKTFTNPRQSPAFQKAGQAQRNFINAVLRRESGAVISDEEFENARQQYFPQPGDSQEVITQKAQNRVSAISGIQGAMGQPQGEQRTRFKFNPITGNLE